MQFLIETDILNDYLMHRSSDGEPSLLRQALAQATCYTTMINAMELFASATDQKSRDATMNLLMVVRVLGFSARYAEPFAALGKQIEQEKKTGTKPARIDDPCDGRDIETYDRHTQIF